jgi:hypothetical protein
VRPLIALINFLYFIITPALLAKEADPICLAQKCGTKMLSCGLEKECANWLQCVIQCGDDKIRCPSFCGSYYQSERINETSSCIFASACVELGFSQLPNYEHQSRAIEDLRELTGTYWFVASHGGSQIFDYDCQRFDFAAVSPELTAVGYSVPLTRKGQTRIRNAAGLFRSLPSGVVEVTYDNFASYHENWYLTYTRDELILAHVCIGAETACHDYGTIILARKDMDELTPAQRQGLDAAVAEQFGLKLEDFKRSAVNGCANSRF